MQDKIQLTKTNVTAINASACAVKVVIKVVDVGVLDVLVYTKWSKGTKTLILKTECRR